MDIASDTKLNGKSFILKPDYKALIRELKLTDLKDKQIKKLLDT